MASKIWFTGCTHLGHANIIKLANRPFANVQEMDDAIIENHNKRVKKGDVVLHLGDVAWGKPKQVHEYIRRLNGSVFILKGNHDEWMGEADAYTERKMAGREFVLCHYPIEDWNGRYRGSIHLHCHTHSSQFLNPRLPYFTDSSLAKDGEEGKRLPDGFKLTCNRFNVSMEATGYAPVSLDEIIAASEK